MDNPCKTCKLSASEKAACCGCPDRLKWEREQKALKSLTGKAEEEKEYFGKIHSIAFLDFLFDHMNPNEMEDYISMYLCSDEKGIA